MLIAVECLAIILLYSYCIFFFYYLSVSGARDYADPYSGILLLRLLNLAGHCYFGYCVHYIKSQKATRSSFFLSK